MKITRILALAVVMVCMVFAASALADELVMSAQNTAVALKDPVFSLQSNKQVPSHQQFNAVHQTEMALVSNEEWVKERVGAMPLNVFRELSPAAEELAGFRDVAYKPNIDAHNIFRIGFTGASTYARAPDLEGVPFGEN